jgi:hypothetical protein
MDPDIPFSVLFADDKGFVVAAYRLPILGGHANDCDIGTTEGDGPNRFAQPARFPPTK